MGEKKVYLSVSDFHRTFTLDLYGSKECLKLL